MGAAALFGFINQDEQRRRNEIRRMANIKTVLRDTSNPFLLPEEYFIQHYRLTPHLAFRLIEILHDRVVGQRVSAIPAHLQILSVIRFLAEGSLQKGSASDWNHPVSQATMSRCIDRVVNAIEQIADQYIQFPNTRQHRVTVKNRFRMFNRIPGVIGLIDCFKVTFFRPKDHEEAFYNYNVGTAMNVQVITDADYIITSIKVCPGSHTDQFIWRHSEIKDELELLRQSEDIVQEEGYYYLLGDNGYTLSPVLLTPIINAIPGTPEEEYTDDLVKIRCRVEQCFGILTNVWRAISRSRKLYYSPEKVAKIIVACAVLHNFRKLHGMIDIPEPFAADIDVQPVVRELNYQEGLIERDRIINMYYT